jgi:hypothetical protein
MTTYITITDPETDPEAPLTSELAKKWRDNPLAIAEGDTTAPVNAACWHPYNKVTYGDANTGLIWTGGVDPDITNSVFKETPNWQDRYEYRLRFEGITALASGGLFMDIFADTDAVYNPTIQIFATATASTRSAVLEILRPRISANFVNVDIYGVSSVTGNAVSALANRQTYADSRTTAQKRLKARFSTGSFATRVTVGQIFMDRRIVV